jgi:hypothetical protein
MFVNTETFVEYLHGNIYCTWVGLQESTSMDTCFALSCFLETAYMSQYTLIQ